MTSNDNTTNTNIRSDGASNDSEFSGGVYRLKQHIARIAGNVSKCPKSTKEDQVRCKQAIEDAKTKKKNKNKEVQEIRREVNLAGIEEEEEEVEGLGIRKRPHFLGPLDKFATKITPEASMSASKSVRQQHINDVLFKERTHSVHRYVARWVYEAGVPFNAIQNHSFTAMMEAASLFGPGYKQPSRYQLSAPLLKEEFDSTKDALKKQEQEWKLTGCSIMTDAWTDRKRRSIMNLCVNCKEGTTFLSSKESSNEAHTGEHIFDYVLKCIEQVGPQNVVQVVTDNVANNMAAAKMLREKMPSIFWSSCATHTINLMLEGIGKLPRFKKTIDSAKSFTIFIYAHHKTLWLMRSYTKKKEIIRPGVTRFASAFLTLQSLVEKKESLRAMFTSTEWEECKWSKTVKGKAAYSTVLNIGFWNGVTMCLKVFAPQLVDEDEAIEANEMSQMTQPRRSARIPRDLEKDFQSEDEPVEEDNFEFESDEEQVMERYGEEQDELDT
ncbi:hypothetical protein EZV62_024450 [Acer yangbiense]|uniref:DUF659 domain-containing protein n=1 Tax=Acer yangbiense TaxID=1000413 RepID=A0A5C7GVQ2_9ROSI|nr:hypothetical protein EZV62_024450 [Acer yangbiense]